MRLLRAACCSLVALAAASGLAAQDTAAPVPPAPPMPPAGESEIMVEGERIVELRSAADLARLIAGRAASREPLARFNVPLCLSLAIDDAERGREIGRRIIANAKAAGLSIARRGCRPNALVIIREDMRQWIIDYRRSGRRFIGRMKRHKVDRVLRSRDPVYAFQDVEVISPSPTGRIDRSTVKNIRSAAVMADRDALAPFAPVQVADLLTLRLLAPTREIEELASGAPRTIMTLLREGATPPPQEMSRFDRVYLATLYKLPRNANAMEVIMATARTLAQPPAPGGR